MAATTMPRKTAKTAATYYCLPVAAGKTILQGTLVAINDQGEAVPASATAGLTAAGCAIFVDTAAQKVTVERGCWLWENDTTAPVTQAHIGKPCYMLDNQTVTVTADGSSEAGKVIGLEDGLVAVETR